MVGLYLNPPDKAMVVCVDEKSQIQALDRTAPILPLRPGLPEKQTHDYVRHGTTTLFAALEVATGKVTDACYPRHRHEEFLRFLKQVAKTYPRATARGGRQLRHPQAPEPSPAWLAKHPRITLHFTPTSGSWLNMVEIFFGIITRQAIRRGTFTSVNDLIAAIEHLHRRLERTLPTVRLDQDRRSDHPACHQRSTNFNSATLVLSRCHSALSVLGCCESLRRWRMPARNAASTRRPTPTNTRSPATRMPWPDRSAPAVRPRSRRSRCHEH